MSAITDQRMAHLAEANHVLQERAAILRALSNLPRRDGCAQAAELVENTPDVLASMAVDLFLLRIRGMGSAQAQQLLSRLGLADRRRTLGSLTPARRAVLVDGLRREAT